MYTQCEIRYVSLDLKMNLVKSENCSVTAYHKVDNILKCRYGTLNLVKINTSKKTKQYKMSMRPSDGGT